MRVFNFSAGPAVLPEAVLQRAAEEMLDWRGSGMSVMEMSHRSKAFIGVAAEAEADLRELMAIPSNYKVLFLQGGASGQFAAIPLNIAAADSTVDYVNTGNWSKKAITEAKAYCATVNVVADSGDTKYCTVPDEASWKRTPNAAYLHYTPNETIGGVEFKVRCRVGCLVLCSRLLALPSTVGSEHQRYSHRRHVVQLLLEAGGRVEIRGTSSLQACSSSEGVSCFRV